MISNISFSGVYKIKSTENDACDFLKFQNFATQKQDNGEAKLKIENDVKHKYPYTYTSQITMQIPDFNDDEFEAYLTNNGIKFKKIVQNTDEIIEKLKSKVADPPENYKKVYVNHKKLENLIENQETNIEACEINYNDYSHQNGDIVLSPHKTIPATKMNIYAYGMKLDDIKKLDKNNLPQNNFLIDFSQEDSDYFTYFMFRNAGMENVPIYVNNETYEIANALGIISEE
jgi:hypothetical protein